MHTAAGVITCAAGSGRRLEPPGRVPAPRQEQGPVGTISSGPVARELVRRSLARGDQAVARSKGRSGQRRDPLARSQRKWAETGRRVGPQTGPSPPRKPCKQAKLRASERLDRTQEAAGSSPASSIQNPCCRAVSCGLTPSKSAGRGEPLARSLARSQHRGRCQARRGSQSYAVSSGAGGSAHGT